MKVRCYGPVGSLGRALCADRRSATAPATWGVAMEVPLRDAVAAVDPIHADGTPTPGAKMSTILP